MLNSVAILGRIAGRPLKIDDMPAADAAYKVQIRIDETQDSRQALVNICIWEELAQTINDKYSEETLAGIKGYLKTVNDRLYVVATRVSFMTPMEADND
jgi:hypothetical protein